MSTTKFLQNLTALSAILIFLTLFASSANGEIRLPGFFSNHMVFQQEMKIPVWGWGDAGEEIKVTFGDESQTITVAEDGTWKVEFDSRKATKTPTSLIVAGSNKIELKDILIGEVWLCSGQSNMEWSVRASANAKAEIAAAKHPLIRHMKVPRRPADSPQSDIKTKWEVCSPATVANFTACGYFMARELQQKLDVPIGLVNSSWGGTRVEPWTAPVGFEKVPALKDIYQAVMLKTPGTDQRNAKLAAHIKATEDWATKAKAAMAKGDSVTPSPTFPAELAPYRSHQDPTRLYNGMIHALINFPVRGAIWYQGESNHTEGMMYFEKKKALINGWRKLWNQPNLPFYFVQIAPFQYGNEDPAILAKFWEAQEACLEIQNTGMVVINDIATLRDIHPPNKQDVGKRLSLLALKNEYGKDVVANSPRMSGMEVVGSTIKISFSNAGGGLKTRDGKSPSHFEMIGADSGGFQAAEAKIDGNTVTLSSSKVKNPTAFRFAWNKLAEPNLCGGTGLPVGAFRGGKLPEFMKTIPQNDRYKLVYELDLKNLGGDIKYDVDNSKTMKRFDRVGYLVELESSSFGDQKVFVSMDAFTNDASKLGIPFYGSKIKFQQKVKSMDVYSNVKSIKTGTDLRTGNIEFWSHNYGPQNSAGVPGAANIYDFGDSPGDPENGYGCMQVHNHGAKQTLFAINQWRSGVNADIGIGNSDGQTRDWTFKGNAKSYSKKTLKVFVRTIE